MINRLLWDWFMAPLSGIGSWKRQIDMCQWVVSQCQSPTNRNVQDNLNYC